MKKSIGASTQVVPFPVWVVGTYDEDGKPNMATVAAGGICCSRPPCIYVSLREATHSYNSIMKKKAYTVNIPGEKYWRETDYVGIASGRDTDKFKDTELTPVRSIVVDAPYVEEFPLILECELKDAIKLGLHTMFIAEIIDIKADEENLNDDRPDIQIIRPIIFSLGDRSYYSLGPRLAKAYTIKKPLRNPCMKHNNSS